MVLDALAEIERAARKVLAALDVKLSLAARDAGTGSADDAVLGHIELLRLHADLSDPDGPSADAGQLRDLVTRWTEIGLPNIAARGSVADLAAVFDFLRDIEAAVREAGGEELVQELSAPLQILRSAAIDKLEQFRPRVAARLRQLSGHAGSADPRFGEEVAALLDEVEPEAVEDADPDPDRTWVHRYSPLGTVPFSWLQLMRPVFGLTEAISLEEFETRLRDIRSATSTLDKARVDDRARALLDQLFTHSLELARDILRPVTAAPPAPLAPGHAMSQGGPAGRSLADLQALAEEVAAEGRAPNDCVALAERTVARLGGMPEPGWSPVSSWAHAYDTMMAVETEPDSFVVLQLLRVGRTGHDLVLYRTRDGLWLLHYPDVRDGETPDPSMGEYVLEDVGSGVWWLRDCDPWDVQRDPLDRPIAAATAMMVRRLRGEPGTTTVVLAGPWLAVSDPVWTELHRVISAMTAESGDRVRLVVPIADRERLSGARRLAATLGGSVDVQILTPGGFAASQVSPVDVRSTAADPTLIQDGLTERQRSSLAGQRPWYRLGTEDLFRLDSRPPAVVRRHGLLPWPQTSPIDGRHVDIRHHVNGATDDSLLFNLIRDPAFPFKVPHWIGDRYRYWYRIDGARAPGGIDVNATLYEGWHPPHLQQVLAIGGVAGDAVVEAWEVSVHPDHGVTLRPLPFDEPEPLPVPEGSPVSEPPVPGTHPSAPEPSGLLTAGRWRPW